METEDNCGRCVKNHCENCPLILTDKEATVDSPLDGMVRLPTSLTAENGAKGLLIGEFTERIEMECGTCHGDTEIGEVCEDCDNGYATIIVPVSWTTIKEIYAVIVKNLAG